MSIPCTEMERANKIGDAFVRMYYKVMQAFPSHLHLFYESDSSVVVFPAQEEDSSLSLHANDTENVRKLLRWMYDEVNVNLFLCMPQPSMNGSILIVVTGKLQSKNYDEPRSFTQVLVLKRQSKGYYVKTDTMHISSKESSMAVSSSWSRDPLRGVQFNSTVPIIDQKPSLSETTMKARSPSGPVVTRHQPNDSCLDCTLMPGLFDEKSTNIASVVPLNYTTNNNKDERGMKQTEGELKIDRDVKIRDGHSDCKSMDQPEYSTSQLTPTVLRKSSELECYEKNKEAPQMYSEESRKPKIKELTHSAPGSLLDGKVQGDSPYLHNKDAGPVSMTRVEEVFKQPELKSMFAARLPLGATPFQVHSLFSRYGTLNKTNAVKMFTGPTHCYACVTFESEVEMRKALAADIRLNDTEIVKEVWAPRSRGGRRTGREITHRPDSKQNMYRAI